MHVSRLLILEDVDHLNPMGVTISNCQVTRCSSENTLFLTAIRDNFLYIANQISGYHRVGFFVLSLVTKKDKIESQYFLLRFQANKFLATSIPSIDLYVAPRSATASVGVLISLHSYWEPYLLSFCGCLLHEHKLLLFNH